MRQNERTDKKMHKKISTGQRIFNVFNVLLMLLLVVIMFYPVWYVIVASFTNSDALISHKGILLRPKGFTINAYKLMMKNPMIVRGYLNSIFLVVAGVTLNLVFTSIAAYVLSRKNLFWNRFIMLMIIFTMYFSGGLIPNYLLVSKTLHLNNTYWALLLPTLINTYNMIIMRTSFAALPDSLIESASLDGAGHWRILARIVVPLSMPVIAVIILYYAVEIWNSWFNASIYIKERTLFPLQLILREILIDNDTSSMTAGSGDASDLMSIAESVKYAVIVFATLPILCVYPFLQKYFVKGIMIGSVKG